MKFSFKADFLNDKDERKVVESYVTAPSQDVAHERAKLRIRNTHPDAVDIVVREVRWIEEEDADKATAS